MSYSALPNGRTNYGSERTEAVSTSSNRKPDSFPLLEHIPGRDNYSLPANSILSLYNDRNNNIWAGSIRNGLISIREVSMVTYTDVVPGNDRGLSNNTILSLYQQSDDKIWIGTDGGGVNLFNPLTEKFTHYLSTWEDKVASICQFTPRQTTDLALLTGSVRLQSVYRRETTVHNH